MPYVNIQITAGASRAQKAQVIAEVTRSLVEHLGKRPEHVHVVIQEIREEDWGFSGMPTDEWRTRTADPFDASGLVGDDAMRPRRER